jgi:hypothetical protein
VGKVPPYIKGESISSQQIPGQDSALSHPWYRRRLDMLVFSMVVGLCALVGLVLLGGPALLGGCSAEERAVYEEFPTTVIANWSLTLGKSPATPATLLALAGTRFWATTMSNCA